MPSPLKQTYELAQQAADGGFVIGGFASDLYEDARIFSASSDSWVTGTALTPPAFREGGYVYLVLLTPDGLQLPVVWHQTHSVWFALPETDVIWS